MNAFMLQGCIQLTKSVSKDNVKCSKIFLSHINDVLAFINY